MKNLLQDTDICCLQEHWLYNFELKELDDISANFSAHAKAVDYDDPISPLQVPRGYGGTATLYKKNWKTKTELFEDGCDRIVVLQLDSKPKVCIINTYLPCRGNNSRDKFQNVISELEEIIEKFSGDHALFLCGDLNASLSRNPPNERDILLREFVSKHQLFNQQTGTPTFYHASGESQAEIDYILKNSAALSISSNTVVEGVHPVNVSDHVAISTDITICIEETNSRSTYVPRPNWDKCNHRVYVEHVNNHIVNFRLDQDQEGILESIRGILHSVAADSIPNFIPNKDKLRKVKPKICSLDISLAAKASRQAWGEWKQAGSPSSNTHPLKVNMKNTKRSLRSKQRILLLKTTKETWIRS